MIYLVCLIAGGALLALSLVHGLDHDGGLDGHDLPHALAWLNLRSVVTAVTFFGLAGVLMGWLGRPPGVRLAFASVTGVLVAGVTGALMYQLRTREVGTRVGSLVGRTGRVLVAPAGTRPGKIKLELAGQLAEVLVRSEDELRVGEDVIVVEAQGGLVSVRRWDGR
ncbi:hypothetical protein [Deinococcus pimensis]|uniref:hypothetical protein n=1 Tax=Deinococcus pimensis TaxID=309888 RepID=UPI0004813C9F|nr:hypothetical protein [Deinococcus pimensis]